MAIGGGGVSAVHASETGGSLFLSVESDTRTNDTAHPRTSSRAKALPLGNPLMRLRRIRAVRTLATILEGEKEIVRACMLGVSRALVAKWLSKDAVDRNPAPLALLWALDDETFDRFVDAVRADRRAQSEGK